MYTFFDPSRRWRELRAIAEQLQSDVFMFRTRTGNYAVDRAEPRGPEQDFLKAIQASRVAVIQLAALTESSFTMKYNDNVYRHGQNEASAKDTFAIKKLSLDAPVHIAGIESADAAGHILDDHHSPMCVQNLHRVCVRCDLPRCSLV